MQDLNKGNLQYLKWINENQWLNLIFLSLAILSIFISFYLYWKSRKRKRPLFDIRSINVISDTIRNIGDIIIQFKGEKIENLTVTKIAIWNSGNDTIHDVDQAPTDKLRIEAAHGYSILESEIIHFSSQTSNIRIIKSDTKIDILFDYLDPNDGGVIKLIHTGQKSSDISLFGTFKGSEKLKRINTGMFFLQFEYLLYLPILSDFIDLSKKGRLINKLFSWLVLATGIGFLVAFVVSNNDLKDKLFYATIGLLYCIVGLFAVFKNKSMPKGFEVFYDDE